MAWQFKKSKQIFPGIRLNFSKSGISTSFGTKGARFTIGKRGLTTSLGIPGTGLYYRTTSSSKNGKSSSASQIGKSPSLSYSESFQKRKSSDLNINRNVLLKQHREKKIKALYQGKIYLWAFSIMLCIGFLMGGNPDWSLGTIGSAILVNFLINKNIKYLARK